MNISEFSKPIELHDTLNPKLWDGDHLKPEVRKALLKIAKDFKEYVDIPFKVIDVCLCGGNANYTYTDKSDLDLHLIVDYSSVACDREADELFDTKRLLYKQDYDITVLGIPVELYVEDSDYPAVSSSYSLLNDRWVTRPKKTKVKIDLKRVEEMTETWRNLLIQAMRTAHRQSILKVLKLLKTYRRMGLKTQGEFSIPNLVYKSLRNEDVIVGVWTLLNRLHDQELSLK